MQVASLCDRRRAFRARVLTKGGVRKGVKRRVAASERSLRVRKESGFDSRHSHKWLAQLGRAPSITRMSQVRILRQFVNWSFVSAVSGGGRRDPPAARRRSFLGRSSATFESVLKRADTGLAQTPRSDGQRVVALGPGHDQPFETDAVSGTSSRAPRSRRGGRRLAPGDHLSSSIAIH